MEPRLDRVLTAVYRNDLTTLRQVSRADLNRIDEDGRTPLMHAVLAEHQQPDLIKFLSEQTDNLDQTDSGEGWTALHFAARDLKRESVRLLLEAGASVDPENAVGNTPLFLAVTGRPPDPDMLEDLLRHGAEPSHKNHGGVSPLSLAHTRGWVEVEALMRKGTQPDR